MKTLKAYSIGHEKLGSIVLISHKYSVNFL